jgi:hypothetical protein
MPIRAERITRRWRRSLRLSVRALIVLVLVVGGLVGRLVHSARIQRNAADAIERAYGFVVYSVPFDDRVFDYPDAPIEPLWARWLANAVGTDVFCNVWSVSFSRRVPLDQVLAHVAQLSSLRRLDLSGQAFPDDELAGIDQIRALTSLTHLAIDCTRISNAGLVTIGGLPQLISLQVGCVDSAEPHPGERPEITESGIERLKLASPKLEIFRRTR